MVRLGQQFSRRAHLRNQSCLTRAQRPCIQSWNALDRARDRLEYTVEGYSLNAIQERLLERGHFRDEPALKYLFPEGLQRARLCIRPWWILRRYRTILLRFNCHFQLPQQLPLPDGLAFRETYSALGHSESIEFLRHK